MDISDEKILGLFFARDQKAISETDSRYGALCTNIAKNILGNREDAEECVNDAILRAWNTIPPKKPEVLSAYLSKITRNLAFDRYRRSRAAKRGEEMNGILDELAECVSGNDSVEGEIDRKELAGAIDTFVSNLDTIARGAFVCRYWYAMTLKDIAARYGKTTGNISVILCRTREKLKKYLIERGYDV